MSRGGLLRERLVDGGFAAGWGAVKLLPEPVARAAFSTGGGLAARRGGAGVAQLRANLSVVTAGRLDEAGLDDLTRRGMQSYARYWQEAFRLPTLGTERIRRDTTVPGREHIERARAEGRPMVLALPHSGNWDAAGAWFADWLGAPFMTVAERLRPESLYRRFLEYRESLGMRVIPLTGGERSSTVELTEWVGGGGSCCLLVDRDIAGSGVPVTFFGRPSAMPSGPALLAARTGAALLPVVCQFSAGGWRLVVHPEVPLTDGVRLRDRVTAATQQVAAAFETSIAARPEDWHALGPIWPGVVPAPRLVT